jgi:hypothetical protein
VIDALDQDKSLVDVFSHETTSIERLEAVSEVLLLFLHGLTDGIIDATLWHRIEQATLSSLGQGAVMAMTSPDETFEDDKATILDILGTAPNHNISFVFLAATLAKIASDLAPMSKADLEIIKSNNTARGGLLGRRSLSFRRGGGTPMMEALAALEKRQAKERRYAEIFGKVVCRAPIPDKDKDKRILEDRQRAVVELFLRRRGRDG